MLAHVVERLRAAAGSTEVVVATDRSSGDDALAAAAAALGATVVRGIGDDVLARYVSAARAVEADAVVRVTADCPVIDPDIVDTVIDALMRAPGVDYASNTHRRSYPRGLDVEALLPRHARAHRAARHRRRRRASTSPRS